jgi:hypothetical protein
MTERERGAGVGEEGRVKGGGMVAFSREQAAVPGCWVVGLAAAGAFLTGPLAIFWAGPGRPACLGSGPNTSLCIGPGWPGPTKDRAMPCLGWAKKLCFGPGHRTPGYMLIYIDRYYRAHAYQDSNFKNFDRN